MDEGFRKEESLIELVREKPYLYDKKNKSYKDVTRKNNAFEEIGNNIGLSGKEAKDLWEKLRKQYTNYLSKLKSPSGSGVSSNSPFFRHSGTMQFYQGVYKPYKLTSNINEDDFSEQQGSDDGNNFMEENLSTQTPENIEVNFEGFNDEETPPVIVHQQKGTATPTTSKSRGYKRRPAQPDDFNERFFAAIEKTNDSLGDEFDHFGANVAARLRKVSIKKPRLGAQLQLDLQTVLTKFELRVLPEECESEEIPDQN